MNRIIRAAKPSDMLMIMQVMESAKKIMQVSGNLHQWGAGYPSEAIIAADMEKGGAFVIEDDCCLVACCSVCRREDTGSVLHILASIQECWNCRGMRLSGANWA